MSTIHRQTAAELGAAALRAQILDSELPPGTRITEDAMAKDLGISRATMRQALNTLLVEGLLVRHPTTRILQVTTISREDVIDIYQARRVLEVAGVEATATISDEGLLPLKDALQQMEAAVAVGDASEMVRADSLCHSRTVGFLGSHHLVDAHTDLMRKLALVMTRVEAEDSRDSRGVLAVHQEFCDLILARKTGQAKRNLLQRLDDAENDILATYL